MGAPRALFQAQPSCWEAEASLYRLLRACHVCTWLYVYVYVCSTSFTLKHNNDVEMQELPCTTCFVFVTCVYDHISHVCDYIRTYSRTCGHCGGSKPSYYLYHPNEYVFMYIYVTIFERTVIHDAGIVEGQNLPVIFAILINIYVCAWIWLCSHLPCQSLSPHARV
jgi:hypothetical protein